MATNDPLVGNPIVDYSNWMGDMYSNIPYKLISMAGAHDAGMYESQHSTNLGSYGDGQNVLTQSKTFKQMLQAGIRYFDVRPGYYIHQDGTKTFRTGHFHTSNKGTSASCTMGATGANLDDILDDVLDFVSKTRKEIVILKFSHYFQYTNINGGVDNAIEDDGYHNSVFNPFKTELVSYVNSYFSSNNQEWRLKYNNDKITAHYNSLTDAQKAAWRIWDCTLDELSDGHSRVVLLFDNISNLSTNDRDYSFKDMVPDSSDNPTYVLDGSNGRPLPIADFILYDCYSNQDTYGEIYPDQLSKYSTTNYHKGDMFLLSWTATQGAYDQFANGGAWPFHGDSIEDLATALNSQLLTSISSFPIVVNGGNLTQTPKVANIIYTDYCDQFVADAANYVNDQVKGYLNL